MEGNNDEQDGEFAPTLSSQISEWAASIAGADPAVRRYVLQQLIAQNVGLATDDI